MSDGPELHMIHFPEIAVAERTERERQRGESQRRYRECLAVVLADLDSPPADLAAQAETILDGLFIHGRDNDHPCFCGCHPHLPNSDLHDYGFACPCLLTAEERSAQTSLWLDEIDAYWNSAEGRAESAARQVEDDELLAWLAANEDVVVTSHGGFAPEQWWGSVDGHSFYFRERHDAWRIELDLRPTGRFSQVWRGGGLDDDASFEPVEIEEGDIIAEGNIGVAGYGERLVGRATFIVGTIKDHLERQRCQVHTTERDDLELLFGRPLCWCPACGTRL